MRIHFFTAPFYFAFIGFKVQGSGFKVQGSGGGFAAFFRECGYPDTKSSPVPSHQSLK